MSGLDDLEEDDDAFFYEVEKIIDMEITPSGTRMFFIKWKNYDESENTWEPEHNLNCFEMKEEFLKQYEERKASKKKKDTESSKKREKSKSKSTKKGKEVKNQKNKGKSTATISRLLTLTASTPSSSEVVASVPDLKATTSTKSASTSKTNVPTSTKPNPTVSSFTKASNKTSNLISTTNTTLSKPSIQKTHLQPTAPTPSKESFISLKRTNNNNNNPTANVDIGRILKSVTGSSLTKYPIKKSNSMPSFPNQQQRGNLPSSTSTATPSTTEANTTMANSTLDGNNNNRQRRSSLSSELNQNTNLSSHKTPQANTSQFTHSNIHQPFAHQLPPRPMAIHSNSNHYWGISQTTPYQSVPHSSTLQQQYKNPKITHQQTQQYNPLQSQIPQQSNTTQIAIGSGNNAALNNPRSNGLPIKRQASNQDPRLAVNNNKKPKPHVEQSPILKMKAIIIRGDKEVGNVRVETGRYCGYHKEIQQIIDIHGDNPKIIKISSFLPLNRLNDVLPDNYRDFVNVIGIDSMIELSKLKSFMQVNEVVGIVSHPEFPTQALVVMPTADTKKLNKLSNQEIGLDGYSQLCILYVHQLPPKPRNLFLNELDYQNQEDHLCAWHRITTFLKFPAELLKHKTSAKFYIFGHTELAAILTKAASSLKQTTKPANPSHYEPEHIMMFDRFNESLFNKQLMKHKIKPATQIWEYGVNDLTCGEITPPCQVFPAFSGGFVTTDLKNIVHNPSIIETIINEIQKFKELPIMYGEWKFILPNNFISQLKRYINDKESAERVQIAIVSLTIALSKEDVQIMRLWSPDEEEPDYITFIETVLRNYYKTHQHFVYIDDISSISDKVKERHKAIDFIHSLNLFSTFSST